MGIGKLTVLGTALITVAAMLTDDPGYTFTPVVVTIDAGEDQVVNDGVATLDGRRSELGTLTFLLADGDGPLEDQLMVYDSRHGVRGLSLRNSLNKPLGWPGDLVFVDGERLGQDASRSRIVTIDPATGTFHSITDVISPHGRCHALAYDTERHELLTADAITKELFRIDPKSGAVERICAYRGLENVVGLAWSDATGLILLDAPTGTLHTIDQESGELTLLRKLEVPAGVILDEITFFAGEMYAAGGIERGDDGDVQVYRIGPGAALTEVGPRVQQTMGHALAIQSVPARTEWIQTAGPAIARIAAPRQLVSEVRFDRPGTYRFELRTTNPRSADSLTIEVKE